MRNEMDNEQKTCLLAPVLDVTYFTTLKQEPFVHFLFVYTEIGVKPVIIALVQSLYTSMSFIV